MPEQPTGTPTFLFTDIEGSTRLWEQHGPRMGEALARHDALMRAAIAAHNGYVFKTVGDAFCAAFPTATDALCASLDAQRLLRAEPWGETGELRVRMALHAGAAEVRDGDYFGPPLNRVARLLSAGYGGQILLSLPTEELARDTLPEGVALLDMGERRLKDLSRPERVFQVVAPDLPFEFPALKTLDSRPNNLPAQMTPFIGREEELRRLHEMLRRPEVRLVTLTGPGGTGKTRLSLQAAAEMIDGMADGVFFVPLAAVTDPRLVPSAIAQALELSEQGGRPILETLTDFLRDRETLLVLDNFEQVLEAAETVAAILGACRSVKILVTSRSILRITGEQEYPVPPLPLPPPEMWGPASLLAGGVRPALSQYAAVELFIQRAEAVRPGFAITNETAPAVAEICTRLDGLPLAIELAAARVRAMTPQEILARLQNRLRLLTGGARNLPARQQTLRGAIDWSYDLLPEGDCALFRRLAVFQGGWTLDTAEELFGEDSFELDFDVLDGLSSLVDHSLVRREDLPGGVSRYTMLGTIREYGLDRLQDAGEADEVHARHAGYFTDLAEQAAPELEGPRQAEWLDRLEMEHDNSRAALDWALRRPEQAETASRLAAALWWFWYLRGYWSEGRERLLETIAATTALGDTFARAKMVHGSGVLAYMQGDYPAARPAFETVVPMWRAVGDRRGLSGTLNAHGVLCRDSGEHARARELYLEALELRREIVDRVGVASTLSNLGLLLTDLGEYAEARKYYEEALQIQRQEGHLYAVGTIVSNLGMAAYYLGDQEAGRRYFEEGLEIRRSLGDRRGVAMSLVSLAALDQEAGDAESAVARQEEALEATRAVGDRWLTAYCLNGLGNAHINRGDPEGAAPYYAEAARLRQQLNDTFGLLECLVRLAGLARARGDHARGARLRGALDAASEAVGCILPPNVLNDSAGDQEAIRAALGDEGYTAQVEKGRELSLTEAVEYGLE